MILADTGHSLGGATAFVFAVNLCLEGRPPHRDSVYLCNYGQPLVGNRAFVLTARDNLFPGDNDQQPLMKQMLLIDCRATNALLSRLCKRPGRSGVGWPGQRRSGHMGIKNLTGSIITVVLGFSFALR